MLIRLYSKVLRPRFPGTKCSQIFHWYPSWCQAAKEAVDGRGHQRDDPQCPRSALFVTPETMVKRGDEARQNGSNLWTVESFEWEQGDSDHRRYRRFKTQGLSERCADCLTGQEGFVSHCFTVHCSTASNSFSILPKWLRFAELLRYMHHMSSIAELLRYRHHVPSIAVL